MFETDYLLLNLFNITGKIEGRKKLQKTVYLLGCSGLDMPLDYEYHYYGPYSSQLQEEVDYLVDHGLLEEIYDDSTYSYNITSKGLILKKTLEQSGTYHIDIDKDLVSLMMNKNSQFLEMVSTYAFFINLDYSKSDAARKALDLKPKLKYLAEEAFSFAEEHNLVCHFMAEPRP